MKYNADQLAKQIVYDNEQYINGNIATYLLESIAADINNINIYLTESEIENNESHKIEVFEMICNNFDYHIDEFDY